MEPEKESRLSDLIFIIFLFILVLGTLTAVIYKQFLVQPTSDNFAYLKNIGYGTFVLLLMVVLGNFYASFIRPGLYKLKHGSYENYRNVSAVPGLGTILVLFTTLLWPQSTTMGITLIVLFLVDAGGLHFALMAIIGEFCNVSKSN